MHWRMTPKALPIAGIVLSLAALPAWPETARPPIRDDAGLQAAVADARARFLADQRFDRLDEAVLPMLRNSDNVATGVVVDAITGAANAPVEGADYDTWFAHRLYTENLLADHGLLDRQRFFNKTYPTNSGEEPAGLEALAEIVHAKLPDGPDEQDVTALAGFSKLLIERLPTPDD